MKMMKNFQTGLMLLALLLLPAANSTSAEYEAMEGVESADAVFDFRIGDAQTALGHLDLIHSMVEDPNMVLNDEPPEFVVVFIGPSVNLITANEAGQGENQQNEQNQQEQLAAVADKIASMAQDGILFEVCMTTAHALDIDPDSILPEINQVGNGWISVIGYQQQGYALVADF
jgi:uncharacterized protein